jgi:syntaxin of plants SYP6
MNCVASNEVDDRIKLSLRRSIEAGTQKSVFGRSVIPSESSRSKQHTSQDNDEFIASESDQQTLLIK